MKNGLSVQFTVVSENGKKYFSSIEKDGYPINLTNFPPFFELIGSKISITSSKLFDDKPVFCTIVERDFPQVPRIQDVRSCFSERIIGSAWPLTTIEAQFLDTGDRFHVVVSQKCKITTREEMRKFLLLKHYNMTDISLARAHRAFAKKMQKMGKETKKDFTEKDVLDHFDFPEVLYFPW